MELLISTIIQIVTLILSSIGIYIAKRLVDYLITKAEGQRQKDLLNKGLNILYDVVNCVQQTYVDSLKDQGKFDSAAQAEALTKARNQALELMSQDIQEAIINNYSDIDAFIETVIESFIKENKKRIV